MDNSLHQDLIQTFKTALANAAIHLKSAESESLFSVADGFSETFKNAQARLENDGILPFVPGNDPHCDVARDHETSKLSIAFSGVYGFAMSPTHQERSPHSVKALVSMQSIAKIIHSRDLAIHT